MRNSIVLTDSSDEKDNQNNFRLSKNKSTTIAPFNNNDKRLKIPKFKINAVEYDDIAKIDSSSSS